jgi:amino acid adenylation domain-containing protein
LHEKMKAYFPVKKPAPNALRILLLDLSQFFSSETNRLDNINDPPLGLITVMSYINRKFGARINGKILKSRTDFDNYSQLRVLLKEFRPDVIGIRTMTYYRDFFHRTLALIRHWGIHIPVIVGGPYAASNYNTLLQDRNVDLAVLGEGEITFSELIEKIIENKGELPREEVLKDIPGLAFIQRKKQTWESSRDIVLVDEILANPPAAPGINKKITSNHSQSPGNLAYVMFTSGSAGKPKGVMIEHKNVVNLLTWFGKNYGLEPGTHVLQMSEYNFDPSVEDIFGSLVHGSVLYVGKRELVLDPTLFAQFVQDHHIHLVDFVPSLLKELICRNPDQEKKLESLRVVISGGEALEDSLKEQMLGKSFQLYNNYGPTEITVDALSARCTGEKVTLGHPISNVKAYILDRSNHVMPIGVPGELCIGGAGVSRGYLNMSELTAEKFFSISSRFYRSYKSYMTYISKKIYKTGDLARWQPDGKIQFLGRMDHQVKIQGYRIELAEIQAQLQRSEGVKEAVVLARENENGETYLCAYITAQNSASISISTLRTHLSRELPYHMIPSHYVMLDRIHLTPGGKIHRSALEGYETKPGPGVEFKVPQSKLEKQIARVWEDVLKVDRVGLDDNFFNLGGNSLRVIQLSRKLSETLEKEIPAVLLFRLLTIREFARYLEQEKPGGILHGQEADRTRVMKEARQGRTGRQGRRKGGRANV